MPALPRFSAMTRYNNRVRELFTEDEVCLPCCAGGDKLAEQKRAPPCGDRTGFEGDSIV